MANAFASGHSDGRREKGHGNIRDQMEKIIRNKDIEEERSQISMNTHLLMQNQCSQTDKLDLLKKQYLHELQKRGNKLHVLAAQSLQQRGLAKPNPEYRP